MIELDTERTVEHLIEVVFKLNKKIQSKNKLLNEYEKYKDDCTFCNGEGEDGDMCSPDGDFGDSSHIRLINGGILEYELCDEDQEVLDSFEINFCPMCGRFLQ